MITRGASIRLLPAVTVLLALSSLELLASERNRPNASVKSQAKYVFLGPDEARKEIIEDSMNNFFSNVTFIDMEVRLRQKLDPNDRDANLDAYKKLVRDSVGAWQPDEISRLEPWISELLSRVNMLYPKVKLPKICLVKTSGQEEGNYAYTRKNLMILPRR